MAYSGPDPFKVRQGGTGSSSSLVGVVIGNGVSEMTANAVTQYAPIIGGASNAVASVSVGSAGQVLQSAGAGAAATYSTATYPLTTTINQLLYSSASNVVTGLATANNSVITTTAAGVPVATALATNGFLLIGSSAGPPVAATLTEGSGISIVNAANSITISATGGGFAWSVETGASAALVSKTGIIANRATLVTLTLPAAVLGDVFRIYNIGAGFVKIAQNASDTIQFGNAITTTGVGGSIAATAIGDAVEIVCMSANTFLVLSSVGNWTVT